MSGRHQSLNGADSAQALADAIALLETYGYSVSRNGRGGLERNEFVRAAEERIDAARQMGDAFMATAIRVELLTMWDTAERKAGAIVPACIACSEPALPQNVYCANHENEEPPVRHPGLRDREPWSGGIASNE